MLAATCRDLGVNFEAYHDWPSSDSAPIATVTPIDKLTCAAFKQTLLA